MKSVLFIMVYTVLMYGIHRMVCQSTKKNFMTRMKRSYKTSDWNELTAEQRYIAEAAKILIETVWDFIFAIVLLIIMYKIIW